VYLERIRTHLSARIGVRDARELRRILDHAIGAPAPSPAT
jgi:hypothetical protein